VTQEYIPLKSIIRCLRTPENVRFEGGITETGEYAINIFKNEEFLKSKKCSCEMDVIQRIGKSQSNYWYKKKDK
jgi:hypothetical protein